MLHVFGVINATVRLSEGTDSKKIGLVPETTYAYTFDY